MLDCGTERAPLQIDVKMAKIHASLSHDQATENKFHFTIDVIEGDSNLQVSSQSKSMASRLTKAHKQN